MTDSTIDRLIDACLSGFHFERVHAAMVTLDWKWTGCQTHSVPTVEKLKERAHFLLREAALQARHSETGCGGMASGGLVAEASGFTEIGQEDPSLRLECILTAWSACKSDLPSLAPAEKLKDLLKTNNSGTSSIRVGAGPVLHQGIFPDRIDGELTVVLMQELLEKSYFFHWGRMIPDPANDKVSLVYSFAGAE